MHTNTHGRQFMQAQTHRVTLLRGSNATKKRGRRQREKSMCLHLIASKAMNQTDMDNHGAKHKSNLPLRVSPGQAPFYPVHRDTPRTRAHPHPGTCGSRPIRVKADKTRSTQPRQPKGQCGRNTPPLKKELAEYQKTPQLQKQLHFRNYLQLKPLFLVGVLHFVQNFVIRDLASVHMQLERPVQLRRGQNRRRR